MKKEIDLEEDVGFYEQTLFSQVSEEADNLENADVQETSAHEAEHVFVLVSLVALGRCSSSQISLRFCLHQEGEKGVSGFIIPNDKSHTLHLEESKAYEDGIEIGPLDVSFRKEDLLDKANIDGISNLNSVKEEEHSREDVDENDVEGKSNVAIAPSYAILYLKQIGSSGHHVMGIKAEKPLQHTLFTTPRCGREPSVLLHNTQCLQRTVRPFTLSPVWAENPSSFHTLLVWAKNPSAIHTLQVSAENRISLTDLLTRI
ncbi:hypothetical protein MA16_Dca003629 [Dendrobium catenatum]|uniref:Uncharacterized protein n=1 Tax=Dendrobium catenatum TaxID=906689 RepID=A0A2I0WFI6_9ASPA|nr:hypothetical protein MA16_Dca003629 [Dendrobium catenatum]